MQRYNMINGNKMVNRYHVRYETNTLTKALNSCISLAKLQPAVKNFTGYLHIGTKDIGISYKLSRMQCQYEMQSVCPSMHFKFSNISYLSFENMLTNPCIYHFRPIFILFIAEL